MPGPKPWIKLWKEKLLSSINIQELNTLQFAVYMRSLLIARDDEPYEGKLCFPGGNPIPDEELAHQHHLRKDRFLGAMIELERRGLMTKDAVGCWMIRKYGEHQVNYPATKRQVSVFEVSPKCQTFGKAPLDTKGVTSVTALQEVEAEAEAEAEREKGARAPLPPARSRSDSEKGHEPGPVEETEVPSVDELVAAFSFCRIPGPAKKREAIEDLLRQGATPLAIEICVRGSDYGSWDFYDIIRDIKKDCAIGRGIRGTR